jgi:type II secretory pathway pseudopilin PulG
MRAVPSRLSQRRHARQHALPGPRSGRQTGPGVRVRPQSGLVLLALLIMLVLVGVGALGAAEVWSVSLKREREAELLFVGAQYRRAIESYWKMSPGRRAYPPSIEVLLTDDRFPNPVHHLRRQYRDPMSETGEFEPIKQANALVGVHSSSADEPIKRAGFPPSFKQFEQAETYAQWQFVFIPFGAPNLTAVPQPNVLPQPSPSIFQGPAPGVAVPQPPNGK